MGKKISELASASGVALTDEVILKTSSGTEKTTVSGLLTGIQWPSCRVHRNGVDQTIANNWTNVELDYTTADYDYGSIFSLADNELKPPQAGLYYVQAGFYFSAPAADQVYGGLLIHSSQPAVRVYSHTARNADVSYCVSGVFPFNGSSDSLKVYVSSMDKTTISGGSNLTYMMAHMVAPYSIP